MFASRRRLELETGDNYLDIYRELLELALLAGDEVKGLMPFSPSASAAWLTADLRPLGEGASHQNGLGDELSEGMPDFFLSGRHVLGIGYLWHINTIPESQAKIHS